MPGLFVGKLATCAEARKLPTARFDAISKRRPLQRSLKRPFFNRGLPEKCQRHGPNGLEFKYTTSNDQLYFHYWITLQPALEATELESE